MPAGIGQITATNANGDPCDQYFNILMNPLMVQPYLNDLHLQGGSPCIDAGDPSLPVDPDQTVRDMGALYFFQAPVFVSLTSQTPVIMVPGGGGSFNYDVEIWSAVNEPYQFDFWTEAIMPDTTVYGPILSRPGITIPVGDTLSRNMNQNVPGGAPSGFYSLVAKVGFLPDSVIDSSELPFMKLLGDYGTGGSGGWETEGWEEELESAAKAAEDYALFTVSPNPFNPATVLSFELRVASFVNLMIYDITGREVAKLVDSLQTAGSHNITFDGSNLASGIYFARLQAGEFVKTQKLLLMK